MLKDIAGIILQGANFESMSNIMLLNPNTNGGIKNVMGSLLYGRNGAGKSTIAKAIKKCKGEAVETIINASFVDKDKNKIELNDEEKNHIFVFDEEFVDENIKFKESGLNTIVMIGQQVEIEKQIQDARKDLNDIEIDYNKQINIVSEYNDYNNSKSPDFYLNKIRASLQGDDSWAGRDKLINGNRQNTRVSNNTYEQFISITTTKTRDQLIIDFEDKLKELRSAQNGEAIIKEKVPKLSVDYDENHIKELLKVKIEKPELSERELYLLELAQTGKSYQLEEMNKIFSDDSVYTCPTCLQPVTRKYKLDLIQNIKKILSKTVEEHQNSLRLLIIQELEINIAPFLKLTSNYETCIKLINNINDNIRNNNLIIQNKIDDPYTPCECELKPVSSLLLELKDSLNNLESECAKYNKAITATDPIKDELEEINSEVAHFDIQDNYINYFTAKKQLEIEKVALLEKQQNYNNTKTKVDELEAKLKNVEVAIDVINDNLKYIFFSSNRFSIDYRNDCYELLSNEKPVKPSQISQGERNIIGLCYFFANILQNQEKTSAYSNEYLLVIDDPVSSFDIENRTGIMSFLRYQLGKFLLGNKDSKVIIMTHDLITYYDSIKIYDELIKASKETFNEGNIIYGLYELRQKQLIQFSFKKRQEYTELVKIIYKYALGSADDYEIVIGNIMRQMLEAFSTFLYKKGIEEISTDKEILSCIGEEYRDYFENLMYRLVLNNGSHRQEQTVAMKDLNFFAVISKEEKQRTAKEILCFVYLLNKQHLLSHLKDCENVQSNIDSWCEEIKNK